MRIVEKANFLQIFDGGVCVTDADVVDAEVVGAGVVDADEIIRYTVSSSAPTK